MKRKRLEKCDDDDGQNRCCPAAGESRAGAGGIIGRARKLRYQGLQLVGRLVGRDAQILPMALTLLKGRQVRGGPGWRRRGRRWRRHFARILGDAKVKQRMSNSVQVHLEEIYKKKRKTLIEMLGADGQWTKPFKGSPPTPP